MVAERVAEIPGQERNTEHPEDGEEGIAVEVVSWRKRAEVVEDAGGDQGDQCKDRNSEELRAMLT